MIPLRIVYIDVLFFYNFLSDLILLKIVSVLARRRGGTVRLLLSAALGGVYACFHFFAEFRPLLSGTLNLFALLLLALCAFRFYSLRDLLKLSALTLAAGFGMGGGIMALYFLFGDGSRFRLQNGIFYLDFSLFQLLISAVLIYLLLHFAYGLFLKIQAGERTLEAAVFFEGRSLQTLALLDTGCRLRDPITGKRVAVIAGETLQTLITPQEIRERYPERYRLIQVRTVGGSGQLEAFRPDAVMLRDGERTFECDVLVAFGEKIEADYQMVLCCEEVF